VPSKIQQFLQKTGSNGHSGAPDDDDNAACQDGCVTARPKDSDRFQPLLKDPESAHARVISEIDNVDRPR
jgi:hypothetical protein